MARRKKKQKAVTVSPRVVKIGVSVVLFGVVIWAIYVKTMAFLTGAECFRVKAITYASSLQFVDKRELAFLKGRNIFQIDLAAVERRLRLKYPQLRNLVIKRRFPNQIVVEARERHPFAQVKIGRRLLTVDREGVVLSTTTGKKDALPLITGAEREHRDARLGKPLKGKRIRLALKILARMNKTQALASYRVRRVDVKNMSKVVVSLSDGVDVIFDWDQVDRKIEQLGVILSSGGVRLQEVRHIDLRFKEPVVKKRTKR